MNNFSIILLLNLLTISISAQNIDTITFNKTEVSKVERYKQLEYKIKTSISDNDWIEKSKLMTEYIQKPEFELLFKSNKRLTYHNFRNDTTAVYLNKSSYSKRLANIYALQKDYSTALTFLNLHETKYLFPHPCGNGYMEDSLRRTILYSEIHQGLENHDFVINKLLPLTFEHSMRMFDSKKNAQAKIDSILLISLGAKYSVNEIEKEFKRCANFPPLKTNENIYGTEIEIFDITFQIFTVNIYQKKERKSLAVSKITEKDEREKLEDEIYKKSFAKAILTNRIYKNLQTKKRNVD